MNSQEYRSALLDFAAQLKARSTSADEHRQTYIARILSFARELRASGDPPRRRPGSFASFERFFMENPKDLLWRISGATAERRRGLSDAGRAMLGVLETCPDLLGPLGQARVETFHSALIAYFLDPRKSGDLGLKCRAAFVGLLLNPNDQGEEATVPDGLDLTAAEVHTERHLGKLGRVDISIESPQAVVLVEVKLDSPERRRQLADYATALGDICAQGNREGLLVFLTCDPNQRPSIAHRARHIVFRQLLVEWLPIATSGSGSQYVFLSMYLKTIAAHLCGLAGDGHFDSWSLATQRASLQFLETELELA